MQWFLNRTNRLTKFRQNRKRSGFFCVDLTWNDPTVTSVIYLCQHLGLEDELFGDRQKRKLGDEQWEEELILGLKRSRLQEDSAGRLLMLY